MTAARKWYAFKSAPKDGTWIDVLCVSLDGAVDVEVKKLHYTTSRAGGLKLRGVMNRLSPYLKPKKWSLHQP